MLEIEEPVCHESLVIERVDTETGTGTEEERFDIEMDYDFLQFQQYKDPLDDLDSIVDPDEFC